MLAVEVGDGLQVVEHLREGAGGGRHEFGLVAETTLRGARLGAARLRPIGALRRRDRGLRQAEPRGTRRARGEGVILEHGADGWDAEGGLGGIRLIEEGSDAGDARRSEVVCVGRGGRPVGDLDRHLETAAREEAANPARRDLFDGDDAGIRSVFLGDALLHFGEGSTLKLKSTRRHEPPLPSRCSPGLR
jgi:hypothetical protein